MSRFFLFMALLALLPRASVADGPGDSRRIRGPLSPKDALKRFVLHPELKIELVACEPQVVDPVAIRFDEDGRLWVVEMRDYPNGPPKGKPPLSRIRVLTDRDGDGFYENATTFADKLLFATGLQPWKGGVIVTLAGEVAYLKDTNGDNKADLRETWFTGFAEKNPQLRANHPTFALDNQIYIANGLRGGDVIARKKEWAKNAKPVSISGMDFRFDPRTGKYEAVSGVGQFGLTFDDFGNRFVCSNRNPCRHVVLENRYLKRNPHLAVRSVMHDASPAGAESKVYPISRTWTTSTLHAGQFTAACGVTIYRGDALPKEFHGNSFVCEPTGNLVHRDVLRPMGATFSSRPGRKGVEFLATKDEWHRPVNLANGPDGALYVVDMYRAVIEHPQWVPDELKNRPDARHGDDRGRIYRIVSAKPFERDPKASGAYRVETDRPKLSRATSAELVTLLEHSNAWHRTTAARLLYERQDKDAAKPLEWLVTDTLKQQVPRVHALSVLQGLGVLDEKLVKAQLLDPRNRRRREPQMRLLEHLARHLKDKSGRELHVLAASGRRDGQALLQYAHSAGEFDDERTIVRTLSHLGMTSADDPWIQTAIVASARSVEHKLMEAIIAPLQDKGNLALEYKPHCQELFERLGQILGARGSNAEWISTLITLNRLSAQEVHPKHRKSASRIRLAGLLGFADGLVRRQRRIVDVISSLPEGERAKLKSFLSNVTRIATSKTEQREQRLEVIPLLAHIAPQRAERALEQLALHEKDRQVRLAAIRLLADFAYSKTDKLLLASFKTETPDVKRAVLDLYLSGEVRTTLLLDAIAAKRIAVRELDPSRVRRLTRHRNKTIRNRAEKLLAAAIPADRKKVLAEYRKALALKAEAKRGKPIFKKHCAACHQIGDVGVNVAPDIGDSRTKTPAQLLTSILDPNRAIDNNYISYTVVLKTGKVQTGIIATETSSSITLRQAENKSLTLLRSDIDVLKSNGISLMPVGLEKNITVQQMADLISFIKNWRYLDGRVPVLPRKKD